MTYIFLSCITFFSSKPHTQENEILGTVYYENRKIRRFRYKQLSVSGKNYLPLTDSIIYDQAEWLSAF